MASSSSPVLPGDVEWLPGAGGARLLRIHPASPSPPVLILRCGGEERRIEAAASEYVIPAALDWSAAWLQWPDGTRAAVPAPHGTQAEVIELRPWRSRSEAVPTMRADAVRERPATPAEAATNGHRRPRRAGRRDLARSRARDAGRGRFAGRRPGARARSAQRPVRRPSLAGTRRPVRRPSLAGTRRPVWRSSLAGTRRPLYTWRPAGIRRPVCRATLAGTRRPLYTWRAAGPASFATRRRDAFARPVGLTARRAARADGANDVRTGEDAPRASPGPDGAPWWASPPPLTTRAAEDPEAVWSERHGDLARDLAAAAAALGRARLGERTARDAVLVALASTRADLRAARAARAADLSALATVTGELDAERSAHAVTRGSIGTLADSLAAARVQLASERRAVKTVRAEATANLATARAEASANLATARAEIASLRSALEVERAARAAAEAELRERAGLLRRIAELDRAHEQGDLEARAREQAEAAAAASRRPPAEAALLLANLDAAAAALRAAVRRLTEASRASRRQRAARQRSCRLSVMCRPRRTATRRSYRLSATVPAATNGDAAVVPPVGDVPAATNGATAISPSADDVPSRDTPNRAERRRGAIHRAGSGA